MNSFAHNLPPANVDKIKKCDIRDLQGYLELEVSLINFIDTRATDNKLNLSSGKLPDNQILIGNKKFKKQKKHYSYDTSLQNIIINNKFKNSASVNENFKDLTITYEQGNKVQEKGNCNSKKSLDSIHVKIVWCGERTEEAANVSISCKAHQPKKHTEHFEIKTKRKYNNKNFKRQPQKHEPNCKHQQQSKRQYSPLSANNKLRYRICTNGALFLEYLRSCEPIKIIVTGSSDSCLTRPKTLGQTQFGLPLVLIKKFNNNIVKGHNFNYKTKVYALYNKKEDSVGKTIVKSGEIQLRFKMLFAPTAAASASAVAATKHTNVVMHDKQHIHGNHYHQHHHNHHHRLGGKTTNLSEDIQVGDIPKRLTSQTKSEEIVEAMMKLDAKLVAYLAGETDFTSKLTNCEEENVTNLNLENKQISNNLEDMLPATKFNIFKTITGIKLEMEALTLQSEGTQFMNLVENEIEPIFTVECQLSNELIKLVPRHDMFHLMQFESEKFHSLTQCTRFAKKAERAVKLDINADWSDENANETVPDFGRVHFTVWWREPGTCLNEMLGMGVLEINDLYNASLLEQCKRIEIQRRGKHLACLYFKITLQRDSQKSSHKIKREIFLSKQNSTDSDSEKTSTTDKNKNTNMGQQQTQQCAIQANTGNNNSIPGMDKVPAQNNNIKLETTNFEDETSKIRLLKGFIRVNETRYLEKSLHTQAFLICRRFWLDEPAAAKGDGTCNFNYQEQFSVINDEKFLQRVDKQFLHLELWQRMSSDDGNGNLKENAQPLGVVRMPLHQFFIAYRDAAITNHLCKGKMPVISIDTWAPIINCQTGLNMGEIKCLLAVGSDEQIKNLKTSRGFDITTASLLNQIEDMDFIKKLEPLQIPTTSKTTICNKETTAKASSAVNKNLTPPKLQKTSELLDMLQKALMKPSTSTANDSLTGQGQTPSSVDCRKSSSSCETSPLPLKPANIKAFKFSLEIQRAFGLPLNPAAKGKKGYSKRNASKRFPPNEPPSCYVTFQADQGQYPTYKSHEGLVFATNIVEKSTQPQWKQSFRLAATIDYLRVPQKLFILKVLKKSSLEMSQGRNTPTPMEDAIIGLTALDLSAFVRGLHIAGTFNIVDFNGRVNGQLMLRCQPLEEIMPALCCPQPQTAAAALECSESSTVDSVIDQFEHTLDLTHLNLGLAIKRKFTELEGISQRLRARLGDVTGSELPKEFDLQSIDAWKPTEATDAYDDFDEFEHDLNTPPINEEEAYEESNDNNKYQGKSETDSIQKSE